jgi:hypothetical protein
VKWCGNAQARTVLHLYQLCEVGIVKVEGVEFIPTPYSDTLPLSTTFSSYSDTMN